VTRTAIDRLGLNRARLIPKSGNRKTGPIPVSYTSGKTCPEACPLKRNGCYAESYPVAEHWGDGARFAAWDRFCEQVSALPAGQLWRHNVAGDLPGQGDRLDESALRSLVTANTGKRGFTYTHKPLTTAPERAAVRRANRLGFTVNLSADTLHEADQLARLKCGPVVVTIPSDAAQVTYTPQGRTVIACPAQSREEVTCESCQLCSVANRKSIVGFRAHGQSFQRINRRLRVLQ